MTTHTRKPAGAPGSTGGQFDGRTRTVTASKLAHVMRQASEERNKVDAHKRIRDAVLAEFPKAANIEFHDNKGDGYFTELIPHCVTNTHGEVLWVNLGHSTPDDPPFDQFGIGLDASECFDEYDETFARIQVDEVSWRESLIIDLTKQHTTTDLPSQLANGLDENELGLLAAQVNLAVTLKENESTGDDWAYGNKYNANGEFNPRMIACDGCGDYVEPEECLTEGFCRSCR